MAFSRTREEAAGGLRLNQGSIRDLESSRVCPEYGLLLIALRSLSRYCASSPLTKWGILWLVQENSCRALEML